MILGTPKRTPNGQSDIRKNCWSLSEFQPHNQSQWHVFLFKTKFHPPKEKHQKNPRKKLARLISIKFPSSNISYHTVFLPGNPPLWISFGPPRLRCRAPQAPHLRLLSGSFELIVARAGIGFHELAQVLISAVLTTTEDPRGTPFQRAVPNGRNDPAKNGEGKDLLKHRPISAQGTKAIGRVATKFGRYLCWSGFIFKFSGWLCKKWALYIQILHEVRRFRYVLGFQVPSQDVWLDV